MQVKLPSKDELIALVVATPLKKKLMVLGALVFVLVAGIYFFSISGEKDKINSDNVQIASLERQRLEKQAIANNLAKFRRDVEKLNQELKDAVSLLPNEAEIPELLQKVSELVEKSGLQMNVFSLAVEAPSGFYARVPVNVEVMGSFHEVVVFLDKLAKLSRIVNVTDLKLGDPVFRNQKMLLRSTFIATTFRFIEKGQAQTPGKK